MLHAARTSVHHGGADVPDAGKALPGLRDLAGDGEPNAAAADAGLSRAWPELVEEALKVSCCAVRVTLTRELRTVPSLFTATTDIGSCHIPSERRAPADPGRWRS
jgi:hypothetical protein